MPSCKFQIHISEFCRLLYKQDQDEQVQREHSPEDFDLALFDEASIDGAVGFIAKRIGMTFGDCWEYVVRAGHGCQWGKWNRPNAEEWRDITHIARAMSDHFRGDAMEELVARFVEEAPLRAAEMGLIGPAAEGGATTTAELPRDVAVESAEDQQVSGGAAPKVNKLKAGRPPMSPEEQKLAKKFCEDLESSGQALLAFCQDRRVDLKRGKRWWDWGTRQ